MRRSNILINFSFMLKRISQRAESFRFILDSMLNNPNFPTPTPAIDDYRSAVMAYEDAVQKAMTGDKVAIQTRNNVGHNLDALTRQLGFYVMSVANGDRAIAASSGFQLRKEPARRVIGQVQNVRVKNTGIFGQSEIQFESMPGANSYIVMQTLTPDRENTWVQVAISTRTKVIIGNLEPGKFYYFQVIATGSTGMAQPSDVARLFAA